MSSLSSISNGLEFWSVNQTSIYENAELKNFKNKKLLGEVPISLQKDLLGTNVYRTLEFC